MNDDAEAMAIAVMDVLAPKIDGPPGIAAVRFPVIRFDYEGQMVVPNDDQILALARAIVSAVRTAVLPTWTDRGDGTEVRSLRAGRIANISESAREPGRFSWAILRPGPAGSAACEAASIADSRDEARAAVAAWEEASGC